MTKLLKFRQVFNSICQFGVIWFDSLELLNSVTQFPFFFCVSTILQSLLKLDV